MTYAALISGGIDSPVAAHLFLRQKLPLKAIIYNPLPFDNREQVQLALDSVKRLAKIHDQEIKANIMPFNDVQRQLLERVEGKEQKNLCLLCKRMMLRLTVALGQDLSGLITGESLGQVASQTLDNLIVIDSAVKLPVYRPLLGLDKMEIVEIAKEIGTFSITSQKVKSCSSQPKYPETHAKLADIEKIEEKLAIDQIVSDCLQQKEEQTISA